MALLHVALDLTWQFQKCPESWRLEVVQEINLDNFLGVEGKRMEGGFKGKGKPSKNRTKNMFCLVFFGQHSRNMVLAVGLIII